MNRLILFVLTLMGLRSTQAATPQPELPTAAAWVVVTDGSERGGPTRAEIVDSDEQVVRFFGRLGAIAGERGPVGFAIARFAPEARVLADRDGLRLALRTTTPRVRVHLSIRTNLVHGPWSGELAFQAPLPLLSDQFQTIDVKWSEFVAVARGRVIPGPILDPADIELMGIEVLRSRQDADVITIVPLEFEVELQR